MIQKKNFKEIATYNKLKPLDLFIDCSLILANMLLYAGALRSENDATDPFTVQYSIHTKKMFTYLAINIAV